MEYIARYGPDRLHRTDDHLGYGELASADNDVSAAQLTGEAIVDGHQDCNLAHAAAGRRGGLHGRELSQDLVDGTWRTQSYQVRIDPELPNKNWFAIRDFMDRSLDANATALQPSQPPRRS